MAFFCLFFTGTAILLAAPRVRIGVEGSGLLSELDGKGQPSGFSGDLLREMSEVGGIEFEIKAAPWTFILSEFQAGRLDALANVAITDERLRTMEFSITHASLHGVAYFRHDRPPIRKTANLAGKRIGVLQGSMEHSLATKNKGWGAFVLPLPTVDLALDSVARGEVDAALLARRLDKKEIKAQGLRSEFLEDILFQFHIAVHKGDGATLARLNEALATVRQNGSFDRIYRRWVGPIEQHPIQFGNLSPYYLPIAAVLLAVLAIIGWQRHMVRRLDRQARVLRVSEERYQLAVAGANDGIWDWDVLNRRVHLSPRWKQMRGLEEDEVSDREEERSNGIHPDDASRIRTAVEAHFEGKMAFFADEYRIRCKDGSWKWVLDRGLAQRDASGHVVRMAGSQSDITERKAAEEARRESEERTRQIIDTALDAVITIDAQGRISGWNPQAEIIFGWSASEAIGQKLMATIVPSAQRDAEKPGLWRSIQLGESSVLNRCLELTAARRDGSGLMIEMTVAAVTINGERQFSAFVRDITERKRTEEALRSSQGMLQLVLDNIPQGVFWKDRESRYLGCNAVVTRTFGIEDNAWVLGKVDGMFGSVTPDQAEFFLREDREVMESGQPQLGIIEQVTFADGITRWLETNKMPMRDAMGQVIGLMGTWQDITERKRAEAALSASEVKFATAFRSSPVAVALTTAEAGRILDVNESYCRLMGYSRDELLGHTVGELHLWADLEQRAVHVGKLRESLRLPDFEAVFRHRSGELRDVRISAELIEMDGEQVLLACTEDFTERKRAEQALLEMNQRYQRHETALASLTGSYALNPENLSEVLGEITEVVARTLKVERVGIWTYNRDRVSLSCIELFERNGSQHSTGMELLRHGHEDYFNALDCSDVIGIRDVRTDVRTASLAEAYMAPLGISSLMDAPLRARSGNAGVLCCEHVGPMRTWTADEQTFAVAVANLVSVLFAQIEQQRLEAQLRQRQKLEALGTLAGGIAHDFNNILAAIISFTELARMESSPESEQAEYLHQVLKASQRATGLVRQILSFSRQQKQERKSLQLGPVINEALKLLRSTLPSTIDIAEEISNELPDVLADPTQVHQVVMNLCTNAGHAMKGNPGRLCVRLQVLRVNSTSKLHPELKEAEYVQLLISDTGHGMNKETLKRIFEPFFTTKAPGEGTGLGLSVVHGIIKEHDGVIAVDSEPGRGTTFEIYLPALRSVSMMETGGDEGIPTGNGERVLFVDDEVALGQVANHVLNRLGYQPSIFNSSEAAWAAIQAAPDAYDIVVTDLTMPVMTGIDLARLVLKLRPSLPIVIVSGYTGTLTEDAVRQLGITGLVHKPMDKRALAFAVSRALNRAAKQEKS